MALDPLNSSSLEQLALKGLNNTEYRRTHLINASDVHLKKKLNTDVLGTRRLKVTYIC